MELETGRGRIVLFESMYIGGRCIASLLSYIAALDILEVCMKGVYDRACL
jgi:hypothetical protein